MWMLHTRNEGTNRLMKDYQKVIVRRLIDSDYFITTGEMHELVKDDLGLKENGDDPISRASVIFFMKDLHKWGYAQIEKGTGKGGIHLKYNITLSNEDMSLKITSQIMESLADSLTEIFK